MIESKLKSIKKILSKMILEEYDFLDKIDVYYISKVLSIRYSLNIEKISVCDWSETKIKVYDVTWFTLGAASFLDGSWINIHFSNEELLNLAEDEEPYGVY